MVLTEKEINLNLFQQFQRSQVATRCWRKVGNRWAIRGEPFADDWDANDYQELMHDVKDILSHQGVVIGVIAEQKLKEFAAVKAGLFGKNKEYLDLPYIHVSNDARG